MLFRRFIEALDSKWSKLGLEYEQKEDKLNITGSISSKTYDDGIYIDATLYDSGNLCMTFVFDQIEPTMKIYDLINSFNDNVGYLKAYISQRGQKEFLAIDYYVRENPSELDAAEEFGYALLKVVDDSVAKYLSPITSYTHS